jgi:thiamine pyrophosphokinase
MPAKGVGVNAIVVAGGDAAPEDAALLQGADLVIAADSGAGWLDGLGRLPDVLVGDLDSIDPALRDRLAAAGVAIERHPVGKDASDVELALGRAASAGADGVVILGAIGGGRLDHEIANLLLLVDPRWRGLGLRIVHGPATVRALHAGDGCELEGGPGDLVSLLPLGGDAEGVSTVGLRYPLTAERLEFGRTHGLSNEVQVAPASVSLERGTLLVIETRKEPLA